MSRLVSIVAITAAFTASACAGQPRAPHAADGEPASGAELPSPVQAAEPPTYAPSAADGGSYTQSAPDDTAANAAAPRSAAKAESGAMEPSREERPGLATAWGETRSSRVSSAPFQRNAQQEPFALATLMYNDPSGLRAMTRDASFGAFQLEGFAVAGGALSVRLLDAAGRPLPTYDFGSRRFAVGNAGDRYVIQIQNHTGNRFEAVATVDGLDVIDGRPGAFEKRGYLLGPWATVEIDGFRQNFEQVAAFRFGSVRDSYAAKKGDARNVGVIGVAFFAEQGAPDSWDPREVERRRNAQPFPGRFAQPPSF